MTGDVKQAKTERRRAERRYRKTRLPDHKTLFHHYHSIVNNAIITAKRLYYENHIAMSKCSKNLFRLVSVFYGKSKSCVFPSASSLSDLVEIFSRYFIEKICTIRTNLDSICNTTPTFDSFNGEIMSVFKPVTTDCVKNIILTSSSTSCSLDPIPTPLLIKHIDNIVESVTCIINDSLMYGTVPPAFKHALVNPLLKKNDLDPDNLKNYRPVSNLSFISKVLEKIVANQINNHLAKNQLLDEHQSAYRKLHNTETALLKIFNDLLFSADEKKISVIVLLDLSAAFDTIDHSILLERLCTTFGFNGVVLKWFESYLCGRTQSVVIDKVSSKSQSLSCGVPQGSVLGPLLYTLYTTPLGSLIRHHNINYHMYADDTQLYLSMQPSNVSVLVNDLEKCIADVKNWMLVNKLKLNDDKTESILCNPKSYDVSIEKIDVGTDAIYFKNVAKNLGVTIDENLNMNQHISNLSRAVYLEIRRLRQMSSFVDESSLKTLASSFILSRLDYCNSLFKNLPNNQIDKLQKLQNHAARTIFKKSVRDHVTPLLIDLHWLPIHARIDYKIAVLVFKCLNSLAPKYMSDMVAKYNPSRTLRSTNTNLIVKHSAKYKTLGDRAFSVHASSVWNALPITLRNSSTINTFKQDLKTHLFRKSFYE